MPEFARGLTVPVTTEDFSFPAETATGEQQVRARLYSPVGKPNAPAMVILHGAHHLGIDERRLMGFAAAMASCGIVVRTPELSDIKDYRISEDSVRTIGESVKWSAARAGGPIGVLSHLDLGPEPGAIDKWRLIRFFALVMNAAETR